MEERNVLEAATDRPIIGILDTFISDFTSNTRAIRTYIVVTVMTFAI
jgi:hypothetical protein